MPNTLLEAIMLVKKKTITEGGGAEGARRAAIANASNPPPSTTDTGSYTDRFNPTVKSALDGIGKTVSGLFSTPKAAAATPTMAPNSIDNTLTPKTSISAPGPTNNAAVALSNADLAAKAQGMASAAAASAPAFKFGSSVGSSKVSADELNNWRAHTGNSTGTLGQYMNARDGKTAVAGSANDKADDSQGMAAAQAENPDKLSSTPVGKMPTTDAPMPVPRPANLGATAQSSTPAAAPGPTTPASTKSSYAPALDPNDPENKKKNQDDESYVVNNSYIIKGKQRMTESLIERYMTLHTEKKGGNLFEKAKGFGATIHDTKSKDFSVGHVPGKTAPAEPMVKLQTKGVEKDLEGVDRKVKSTHVAKAQPIEKIKLRSGMEKELKGDGVAEHVELDADMFSEEEIARMNAILEAEGEAPVKRGRGRPVGSKSGSKHATNRNEDGVDEEAGTKNVMAQLRTTRPYFKNGVEVKKITHPTKNTEHELPLHKLNDFNDAYTEAPKPRDKQAVEAAFVKKHMGGY